MDKAPTGIFDTNLKPSQLIMLEEALSLFYCQIL